MFQAEVPNQEAERRTSRVVELVSQGDWTKWNRPERQVI